MELILRKVEYYEFINDYFAFNGCVPQGAAGDLPGKNPGT